MTMMLLGPIRFSVETAAYEDIKRTKQFQWASHECLGDKMLKHLGIGGPALQYIGPGEETIDLNGNIYPQYKKGSAAQMILMRLAAGIGIALPLITGTGFLLGKWIIQSVEEKKTIMMSNGAARKIEFSLSLKHYNEIGSLF